MKRAQPNVAGVPPSTYSMQVWNSRTFGTPGAALSLGAIDPLGRWLLFCQADQEFISNGDSGLPIGAQSTFLGDAFRPYFAGYNSRTTSITALLSASPNGRYVVLFSHTSGPELLDMQTGQIESLRSIDLDSRADKMPGDLRSVAFSPDSSKLALLVHEKQPRVIVRDLQNKIDSEVVPVGDAVWRIAFDAAGQYVVLKELFSDTNRARRTQWPVPERKLGESRCLAPISAFAAFAPAEDRVKVSIARISGGQSRLLPGFVTSLGASLIVKDERGALSAIEGNRTRTISSPDCDGHIVAVAPNYGVILTGCRGSNGRSNIELDSLVAYHKLDVDIPTSSVDWTFPETAAYAVLYSGAHSFLVDLADARLILLEDKDQVLAQGLSGIVIRRGATAILYNPKSGELSPMLDDVRPGTRIIPGGTTTLVGQTVISADQGRVIGTLTEPVLAMAENGCAVVTLGTATGVPSFARGPLTWSCPNQ